MSYKQFFLLTIFIFSILLAGCSTNQELTKDICEPNQRGAKVCTQQYEPVCGWYSSKVKCVSYPCAQEFSNECEACANPNIESTTKGACPTN